MNNAGLEIFLKQLKTKLEQEVKREKENQMRKNSQEVATATRIMVEEFEKQGFSKEDTMFFIKLAFENQNKEKCDE